MELDTTIGLFLGAIGLGVVHGLEPGHGWPVAASYALDRSNKWLSGFAASVILGTGHLVSSIAMVLVFFFLKSYFSLTQVNEPIELAAGLTIGGPVSVVAGLLLIALGIREYRGGGHSHDHGGTGNDHSHGHHDDGHFHDDHAGADHTHRDHTHTHTHTHDGGGSEAADRGLWGIAAFAFALGFAHEEEFEIIAFCTGSAYCLELMLAYALAVIAAIVGLTLLLIAGYERYETRAERYTEYLPAFSAAVLVIMGVGFLTGLF